MKEKGSLLSKEEHFLSSRLLWERVINVKENLLN